MRIPSSFFSAVPSQGGPLSREVIPADLNLQNLVKLGKNISDLSLMHDNTTFLIQNLSVQRMMAQRHHQTLLSNRHFIANQYTQIRQIIIQKKRNIIQITYQYNRGFEELKQIQTQLNQSYHAHQIMTAITEKGLTVYQQLQQNQLNLNDLKKSLIEFQCSLNIALRAMNEISAFTLSLTAIIRLVDDLITKPTQIDQIKQCFFNEITKPLIDLNALVGSLKQSLHLLMMIKSMVTDKLHRDYAGLQRELYWYHRTDNYHRQTLDYLTTELHNSQNNIAAIDHHLGIQRQLASFFARNRFELLNRVEEQRNWFAKNGFLFKVTPAYQHVLNNLQPIFIQDIIVTHPRRPGNGETTNPMEEQESYLTRMVKQLRLLAQFAQNHHQKNCTADGTLKDTCENNITRLITDEFSFYPCEPLSLDAYLFLLKKIDEIARTLPLNIHLIFASFPVLDANELLHNITVHVTSGSQPILHHHSKTRPSAIDFNYGYRFAGNSSPWNASQMTQIHFDRPLLFGFGSIVYSMTAGRARLISNLEVCIEHNYFIGVSCLNEELRKAAIANEIIPLQYSHVLTSRSTCINSREPSNARITQADAERPGIWIRDHRTHTYNSYRPNNVFQLHNFFGKSNIAHVYSPQQVSFLPGNFFKKAAYNNGRIIEEQLNGRVLLTQ